MLRMLSAQVWNEAGHFQTQQEAPTLLFSMIILHFTRIWLGASYKHRLGRAHKAEAEILHESKKKVLMFVIIFVLLLARHNNFMARQLTKMTIAEDRNFVAILNNSMVI